MSVDSYQTKVKQLMAKQSESAINQAIVDSLIMSWRNLIRLSRTPAVIVSVLLFPILFFSGFLLTFERLMRAQGINYLQYILPIITLQSMFFTAIESALVLAQDLKTGMFQRCRVMPISRVAFFGGLVIAYLVRAMVAAVLLVCLAHLYGFRFQTGFFAIVGFFALTLLFTATAITGYAVLALKLRQPDVVNSLVIAPYAPLLFLSTGFSPADNFPSWLQPIVRFQPVSYTASAMRALVNGTELSTLLFWSLIWLIGLLVFFSVIAIRLYQKVS